jgi:6-pyruvoyl tetrahydropterin synthase
LSFFIFYNIALELVLQKNEEVNSNKTKAQWAISKTFKFEAAHSLVHHDGKCSREHGHSVLPTLLLVTSILFSYFYFSSMSAQ